MSFSHESMKKLAKVKSNYTPEKFREKLVDTAFPKATTHKFLEQFYDQGRVDGWFPEKPAGVKKEELGAWMRKNSSFSEKELRLKMRQWVSDYTTKKGILDSLRKSYYSSPSGMVEFFGPDVPAKVQKLLDLQEEKPANKALARFRKTHHADCIGLSTALGEMARAMGFKVKYAHVDNEKLDLTEFSKETQEEIRRMGDGHAYVFIENEQHDPGLDLSYTNHKGKKHSRKDRATFMWCNHGQALFEEGNYGPALLAYNYTLELDPDSKLISVSSIHSGKADAFVKLGWLYDALGSVDKAIEIKPGYAEAHCSKGNIFLQLGIPKKALESFDKAIELSDERARGKDVFDWGRQKGDPASIRNALKIDSNLKEARDGKKRAMKAMKEQLKKKAQKKRK